MNTNSKGTAVITGASSGIGAVYADRLAKRGHDLIFVARNEERLKALSARITADTGRSIEVIVADLNNKADLARIEQVLRTDASITVLVNNAGIAMSGDLASADPDRLESMIRLNVLAPSRLALAVIPEFIARGHGTLINISSAGALAPERLNGGYTGTKAYLLNLSLRLQQEVAGKGVRVQVVLPGATRTTIWEKAGTDIASLPPNIVMDVDEMVDAAIAGLDQGEKVTIPSLPEIADWEVYEAARQSMIPKLSRSSPARRYGVTVLNPIGGR
ncbi:MAG: SDR family NAD(P)-dependent oxidoreductase [Terriglobia bacterium]